MIKAQEGCCEEIAMGLPAGMVLPCNKPAVAMVGWPRRSEGPYRMCAGCADHSVRNRGATIIEQIKPQESNRAVAQSRK